MKWVLRLYNYNVLAIQIAIINKSQVLQLCHPVDLKIWKHCELKHPSYPKVRDNLEDVLILRDVFRN